MDILNIDPPTRLTLKQGIIKLYKINEKSIRFIHKNNIASLNKKIKLYFNLKECNIDPLFMHHKTTIKKAWLILNENNIPIIRISTSYKQQVDKNDTYCNYSYTQVILTKI